MSSTLINAGGQRYCPFPLRTGDQIIGFAYFQSVSSLAFLVLIYLSYQLWNVLKFVMWYCSFKCHCKDPCAQRASSPRQRCPALQRLLAHAASPKAFKRSLLAFVLTSYEPWVEQTFIFLSSMQVGEWRVVSRRPDVHCTSDWGVRFLPALLVVAAVPIVLWYCLARTLRKSCNPCGSTAASAGDSHAAEMRPYSLLSPDSSISASPLLPDASPIISSSASSDHGHNGADESVFLMLAHHFKDQYVLQTETCCSIPCVGALLMALYGCAGTISGRSTLSAAAFLCCWCPPSSPLLARATTLRAWLLAC